MAARESAEMKRARTLVIDKGMVPADAARKVGLTTSAIYMSPWYKEWRDAKRKAKK